MLCIYGAGKILPVGFEALQIRKSDRRCHKLNFSCYRFKIDSHSVKIGATLINYEKLFSQDI